MIFLALLWEEDMTTRDRILEEALKLFSENGYDGTGVKQITKSRAISFS